MEMSPPSSSKALSSDAAIKIVTVAVSREADDDADEAVLEEAAAEESALEAALDSAAEEAADEADDDAVDAADEAADDAAEDDAVEADPEPPQAASDSTQIPLNAIARNFFFI